MSELWAKVAAGQDLSLQLEAGSGGGGVNSFGGFVQEMNVRPLKFQQRQNQSILYCIQR